MANKDRFGLEVVYHLSKQATFDTKSWIICCEDLQTVMMLASILPYHRFHTRVLLPEGMGVFPKVREEFKINDRMVLIGTVGMMTHGWSIATDRRVGFASACDLSEPEEAQFLFRVHRNSGKLINALEVPYILRKP